MPTPTRTPKQLRDTSIHEAGHAVCAYLVGARVLWVTIVPEDDCAGRALIEQPTRHDLDRILLLAGGEAAESVILGSCRPEPSRGDRDLAILAAMELSGNDPVEANVCLLWSRLKAQRLLAKPANVRAVKAISRALLKKGRLEEAEVRRIYDRAVAPRRKKRGS